LLQRALSAAFRDPELAAARHALLLHDVVFLPASCYAELEAFEEPAVARGYFEMPAPGRSPLVNCEARVARPSACLGRSRANGGGATA
jgi:hypothetical protein